MPNPKLYLVAVAAAALMSAAVACVAYWRRLPANAVCVVALAAGIFCGAWLLKLPLVWPPINGLGRVLSVLLPAAVTVELLAACGQYGAAARSRFREKSGRRLGLPPEFLRIPLRKLSNIIGGWCGRLALTLAATPVVLAGSVYIAGNSPQWSAAVTALVLLASGGLLACAWFSLHQLARRPGSFSLLLALAQTAACGGLAIMLKGYLAGGEAAFPLAGALFGCGLACVALKLPEPSAVGAIGVAVVLLFGLLLVGRFFGQLSTARMLVLFLAPLVCWVSELAPLRWRPPWQLGLLRLALVAVPLAAVVLSAKKDFDRDTRPLLGRESGGWPSQAVPSLRAGYWTAWEGHPPNAKRGF